VAKWILEPGHTAAEFCARHMMVTWVRGHFKNIQGTLFFDPANPGATSVEVTIDVNGIWSGSRTGTHGVGVGNTVEITIDAEAILEST
jgi:polyisoprenoid-binding protein YceI